MKMPESIAKPIEQLKDLERYMMEKGHFGAYDTEPRSILASNLHKWAEGKLTHALQTTKSDGWEIFYDMAGAMSVGGEMTAKLRCAIDSMNELRWQDALLMRQWLEDNDYGMWGFK